MSAPYHAAHARERIPLRVLPGRLLTTLLLLALGRAGTAGHRHAPFPDLLSPGTCNVCWLGLGDQVHRWRRRPRQGRHCPPEHAAHLAHMTDGHWHDSCWYCLERRAHGGTGLEADHGRPAEKGSPGR